MQVRRRSLGSEIVSRRHKTPQREIPSDKLMRGLHSHESARLQTQIRWLDGRHFKFVKCGASGWRLREHSASQEHSSGKP